MHNVRILRQIYYCVTFWPFLNCVTMSDHHCIINLTDLAPEGGLPAKDLHHDQAVVDVELLANDLGLALELLQLLNLFLSLGWHLLNSLIRLVNG